MVDHIVEVAVKFTFDAVDHLPSYSDTLFIPMDEFQAMTDEQLSALKQERYDNWVVAVSTPPEVEDPVEVNALQHAEEAITAATDALQAAHDALAEAKATSGE